MNRQGSSASGQSISSHLPLDALAIFALAVMLRVAALAYWNFDGLYGQDAYAYYDYALALHTALLNAQPIPLFWWPPLYPFAVVLSFFVFGMTPFAAQLVNLLAGSLLVTFTYLAAREAAALAQVKSARTKRLAWLAALWLAFSTELVQSSLVVMADTLGLALAVGSAWLLLRWARTRESRWLYGSAALLAFAFLARIQMALLIAPWAAFALTHAWRAWRAWLGAALLGFAIVAPYLLSVWQSSQAGFASYAAEPTFAQWSLLNFIQRDFITPDGHLQYPYPSGIYYAVAAVRGGALTPLVIPFAALGLWQLWRQRALHLLLLLAGWCAAIYLFIAGMPWQNLRFAFPIFPALAIIAAFGVSALELMPLRSSRLTRQSVPLVLSAIIVTQFTLGYRELAQFITSVRANQDIAQWLQREVPADATVVTFSLTLTLAHETPLRVVELYFQTPESLDASLSGEHNYLLLDERSVSTQWAGRAPALNYEFLRDHVGLTEIGTRAAYTLYHIKP